jgi:MFS family permease
MSSCFDEKLGVIGGVMMSNQVQKSKTNAFLVLVGCCAMMLCANGIFMGTAGNYIVPVAREFGTQISTISLYLTVLGLTMMFFIPVMGRLMAKGHPRIVATICMALEAAGYLLFAFWPAPWGFYISGVLLGIGGACITYVAVPLFINSWFRINVGTFLGIATIFPSVGQLIFNPICTNLIVVVGWRMTYLIIGGIGAVIGVLVVGLCLRNSPDSYGLQAYGSEASENQSIPVSSGMSPDKVYRSSIFIPLIITAFIFGYCVSVVSTISAFIMTAQALPAAQVGLGATAVAAGMMIGKIVMGKMYDKFKIAPVTMLFAVIQCVGFFVSAMVYSNHALLFPAMILVGIGIGGTGTIAVPMITRILFGPKHFAAFFPKFTIAIGCSNALSGFLNNYIYDMTGTYASIFYIMGGASIIAGFFIMYAQSKQSNLQKLWETV